MQLVHEGPTFLGKPAQVDPGRYKILDFLDGREFGQMTVNPGAVANTTVETWAVYPTQPNLPATAKVYTPPNSTTSLNYRFLYQGAAVPPKSFDTSIAWTFDRIDATISRGVAARTGLGGAAPSRPWLFSEGRYDLFQNNQRVGALIVEHNTSTTRKQYWFLFTQATGSTGVFRRPSSANSDVNTLVQWSQPFAPNFDINAYRSTLPRNDYLVGDEVYIKTHP
jgi:hypothetical protein